MAATGEVSNYLARNLILSGEAGSGERVGQRDSTKSLFELFSFRLSSILPFYVDF